MIAIIEYGAGNNGSVQHALRRLGQESIVTADAQVIQRAGKVILPGVGEAGSAMARLAQSGLVSVIPALTQPVLAICLGLQLLCRHSEEGDTPCLGIIDTEVRKFPAGHIVPHMGWNNIGNCSGSLLDGLSSEDMYFVHSYYAGICPQTTGTAHYILPFSAAVQRDNFYGTQFHPEKSGTAGERLLKNFLKL